MPNRVFTFEEASALLPAVRERTRRAVEELESLGQETSETSAAGRADGDAERVFRSWAGEIAALGLEVKGPWLVDFDSGAGYYCWKWPENGLGYFHSYEEGFAGRVRLQ